MKKLQIINIIILIIFCMFTFKLNVKASDYVNCFYKHNTQEKDGDNYTFPIYKEELINYYNNPDNNLIIIIQYNPEKENISTPKIWAKLLDASVALNDKNDYIKAMNGDTGFKIPGSSANPSYVFNNLPTINVAQLKNNDDTLMCPNVYLYGADYKNPVDSSVKHLYTISLIRETNDFSEEYKYKKTLTPLGISKTSSETTSNADTLSCSYNIKDYKSTIYNYSGTIGFNINKDGSVSNIIATNSIANYKLKYEGEKLTECPTYIKLKEVIKLTDAYTALIVGSEDSYDGVYNGDISTGEDNQNLDEKIIARYRKYGDNNKSITIEKSAGNYNINLNGDSSGPINISNLSEYMSSIETDKIANYPKYIIKLNGSSEYMFVDSLKNENNENVDAEEIYLKNQGLNGTGLSDEEIISTCTELFGDTFLNFLNDYVFKIIWIGIPILLILLTTFDFVNIVFNDDKDGMAKAFNRLSKRAIASVLIFLTPYIIILIANIVDPTQTTIQSCAKKIRDMGNTTFVINNLTKLK